MIDASRILVVGSPGSGKTTLARGLAERLGLPLVHLDDHYWRPGWQRPAHEEWLAAVARLAAEERWVIDGNHFDTIEPRLARAQLAIHLDYATPLCLARTFRRGVRRLFGERDSLPARIREDAGYRPAARIDWRFVRKIATFRTTLRPALLDALARSGVRTITARTPGELRAFLASHQFVSNSAPGGGSMPCHSEN